MPILIGRKPMSPVLSFLKRVLDAPSTTWVVLALPAPALIIDFEERERYYAEIMYESGLLATQLVLLALAITPLLHLTRGWKLAQRGLRWLQRRRRYIGVAAFCYATLHTLFYLRQTGSLELAALDLAEFDLAIGWLAFALLTVLAATSNNISVRLLGRRWKVLQRAAYAAAALTALHWYLINQFQMELLLWFAPLILLQAYRASKAFPLLMGSSKG